MRVSSSGEPGGRERRKRLPAMIVISVGVMGYFVTSFLWSYRVGPNKRGEYGIVIIVIIVFQIRVC